MTQKQIGVTPFTVALIMVIGLELLFHHLFGHWMAARWQQLGLMGGLRLLQALTVWLCLNHDGTGADRLGLKSIPFKRGVWHGILWSAVFGVCAVSLFWVATINNWSVAGFVQTSLPQAYLDLTLFFTVGGIVGPVTEELVFRGLIYGFFRRWGLFPALVISTFLFVVAHGSGADWLVPLAGGVVFALSYEWSRSLATPIIIHVLGNLAIFSLSRLLF